MDAEDARARMTFIQWSCIGERLKPKVSIEQLNGLQRMKQLRKSKSFDEQKFLSAVQNSWVTEGLIARNRSTFKADALNHSLVWAYPQAYYSAFAMTLAYFNLAGFNQNQTHAALIKKFGDEVKLGHYPLCISSFVDDGIERNHTYHNCSRTTFASPLHLDLDSPAYVDGRIAELLSATRQNDLRDRLLASKLRTKNKRAKTKFSEADYNSASSGEGVTTLLSFLYRKRIKSNYQEVDSILHAGLDAHAIHTSLLRILCTFNLIHEAFIAQTLGRRHYERVLSAQKDPIGVRAKKRYDAFAHLITQP